MNFDPASCFCAGQCRANPAIKFSHDGETDKAIAEARRAVLKAPHCPFTHGALGNILVNSGSGRSAEKHIKASKILGDRPAISDTQLGYCYISQGRIADAKDAFVSAIKTNPNHIAGHIGLIKIYEIEKDYETALTLCQQIDIPENQDQFRETYAKILCHLGKDGEAIDLLSLKPDPMSLFERGKIHERLGNYAAAFSDYSSANGMTGKKYDDALALQRISNHKMFSSKMQIESLPRLSYPMNNPVTPIFITGFPRSGTTILETMLSNHPSIQAGDELKYIHDIAAFSQSWLGSENPYPFALNDLTLGDKQAVLKAFRTYYVSNVMDFKEQDKQFVTDKMPLNEMHYPLISTIFSDAPIIYLHRHPLDTIISNFSNYLTHGFNQSFSLISCATHYARVDDLVDHYRRKMKGMLNLIICKYEDLVSEPEKEMREFFDFMKIEFNDKVLEPESNQNYPRTPSYNAVRKPINDKSIGRWKNFEPYIGDAIRIVEPILEREGY